MAVPRHFLQFNDLSRKELDYLFQRTRWIKERFKGYERYWPLADRTLVMIFEKASTRTRLSFEAGMQQLGDSPSTSIRAIRSSGAANRSRTRRRSSRACAISS